MDLNYDQITEGEELKRMFDIINDKKIKEREKFETKLDLSLILKKNRQSPTKTTRTTTTRTRTKKRVDKTIQIWVLKGDFYGYSFHLNG